MLPVNDGRGRHQLRREGDAKDTLGIDDDNRDGPLAKRDDKRNGDGKGILGRKK
jgi:hypothetical protein